METHTEGRKSEGKEVRNKKNSRWKDVGRKQGGESREAKIKERRNERRKVRRKQIVNLKCVSAVSHLKNVVQYLSLKCNTAKEESLPKCKVKCWYLKNVRVVL